jgi:voltage-gated potassium channel
MNLKQRVWSILEAAEEGDRLSRAVDICILSLIFLNVLAVILGSVPSIQKRFSSAFSAFELFSVVVFTIEYLGRLWSCVVDGRYRRPILGRLRFASTPLVIIDLGAILPFYLLFLGVDFRFVRAFRLLRIIRLAKVGRYYTSFRLILDVFKEKKEELVLTLVMLFLLLVVSACALYYVEHPAQPEAFSSIPASMWWSAATLTTVGYGDVVPITAFGKIIASAIGILGIGMLALPTGILGSGFVEQIGKRKDTKRKCSRCGAEVD